VKRLFTYFNGREVFLGNFGIFPNREGVGEVISEITTV
jgi:hypothetical protein